MAVTFPGLVALTNTEAITLRGTACGATAIGSVRVNGIAASSDDNFATWRCTVPLSTGINELTVETRAASGATDPAAAVLRIEQSAFVYSIPDAFVSDAANNRAIFLLQQDDDIYLPYEAYSLTAFDLTDASPRTISGATRGSGTALRRPRTMVLDAPSNRLLVADGLMTYKPPPPFEPPSTPGTWAQTGHSALFAVDLGTGNRTILSDATLGSGPLIRTPLAMALDTANGRVLMTNETPVAVDPGFAGSNLLSIDLASGDRTSIAFGFARPLAVALDPPNGRAIVLDARGPGANTLLAVDLATGAITTVSDASTGQGPELEHPVALVLETFSQRAYVADVGARAVFAVQLDNGDRSIVSSDAIGEGPGFDSQLWAIGPGAVDGHLLVAEPRSLRDVEIVSGNRTAVVQYLPTLGEGPSPVSSGGMDFDEANDRVLALDPAPGQLLSVDLATGDRTIVVSPASESAPAFTGDVALHSDGRFAYVTDWRTDALYSVDVVSGDYSVVSDASVGSGIAFQAPGALGLDPARNRALVVDRNAVCCSGTLVSVDLASGARRLLSSNSVGAGPAFGPGSDIAVDTAAGRVLYADYTKLLSVNLDNGNRSQIAPLIGANFLALDRARNRVIVLERHITGDGFPDAPFRVASLRLFALNLDDGATTILSDDTRGSGPVLRDPGNVVLDADSNRVFIHETDHLKVVDLHSGDRAIVSK